ncbi:MAG: M28 family peptidase [Candidatus Thorarchaeota archaeon]
MPVSSFYLESATRSAIFDKIPPEIAQPHLATPALWETVFSEPDVDLFKSYVSELASEIGVRDYGSDANDAAQEWLLEQFEAVGDGELSISTYGTYENIWARLPGQGARTQNLLVVGAHLDSLNDPRSGVSPGANDDASGIALLLEAARILRSLNLPATIYFIAFNGHFGTPRNDAFAGGQEMAVAIDESGLTYLMGIDAIRLLYTPDHPRFNTFYSERIPYEVASANAIANMSREYGHDTIRLTDTSSVATNVMADISFFPRGLIVRQSGNDPYSNSAEDIPENYSEKYYENAMEIVGAVCSTLVYLSFMNSSLDYDEDGLLDREEIALGTFPNSDDTDGDGLADEDELRSFYTDPLSRDTDNDGLNDYQEIYEYRTDPLNPDTDHDGIDDSMELQWLLTSPLLNDTDGDGLSDFQEAEGFFIGVDFPGADSDGYMITLPNKADTDADGLDDGYELFESRTNPRDRDTDDDGATDGEEVAKGYDPLDSADTPPKTETGDDSATKGSPGYTLGIMLFVFVGLLWMRFLHSRYAANHTM